MSRPSQTTPLALSWWGGQLRVGRAECQRFGCPHADYQHEGKGPCGQCDCPEYVPL